MIILIDIYVDKSEIIYDIHVMMAFVFALAV